MSYTAHDLKVMLNTRAEEVARFLLPGGCKKGNYWHAGSLAGDEGDSLRVCLGGAKTGVWSDFSSGDAGDLIDLWGKSKNLERKETFKEVRGYLHLPEDLGRMSEPKKAKKLKDDIPALPRIKSPVETYMKGRGISRATLDLLKVGEMKGRNGPEIVFRSYDENGDLLFVKYLAVERPDGKKQVRTEPGCLPVLCGMHAAHGKSYVIITEGETDMLSWWEAGHPAVSVPFGAKSKGDDPNPWIENCYDWLGQFSDIYVCMDRDEEGVKAQASVIQRIGRERCKAIELPAKDANQTLTDYGKAQLTEAWENAKYLDPDDLRLGSDISDKVYEGLMAGPREERGIPIFGWKDKEGKQFRRRQGELTAITGYAGGGKSNMVYSLYGWMAVIHGVRSMIGSYEEPSPDILGIMVRQVVGGFEAARDPAVFEAVKEKLLTNIVMHDYVGTVPQNVFWENARYAVKRFGAKAVLCDSASMLDIDLDDIKSVETFCKECVRFVKETGANLDVIWHARKTQNEDKPPTRNEIKGSGFVGDLSHNVLTAWRFEGKTKVICSKQKVGGELPWFDLHYDKASCRLEESLRHVHPWMDLPNQPHLPGTSTQPVIQEEDDDEIPF